MFCGTPCRILMTSNAEKQIRICIPLKINLGLAEQTSLAQHISNVFFAFVLQIFYCFICVLHPGFPKLIKSSDSVLLAYFLDFF